MYEVSDLFDKRSVVGAKLEQLIEKANYTKKEICQKATVSRPTLDKILAGTLTSKTNYEKHIAKVLNAIEITPDILLGNINNYSSRVRKIRSERKISTKATSKATGISIKRLEEIESGEDATLAELRDIALFFEVSTNDILGRNYFDTQVATLDDFIQYEKNAENDHLSGFWGHVGILLCNSDEYLWFPITSNTREFIYNNIDNNVMVIPCMNNKVLVIFMNHVKEIVLLDEACDQPSFTNWDSTVDCGDYPLVVYEVLEDYLSDDMSDENTSPKMQEIIKSIIKNNNLSEAVISKFVNESVIHFIDDKKRYSTIDFASDQSISSIITEIYDFNELFTDEKRIYYTEFYDKAEIILNIKQISMIEVPLIEVENAIIKDFEELMDE